MDRDEALGIELINKFSDRTVKEIVCEFDNDDFLDLLNNMGNQDFVLSDDKRSISFPEIIDKFIMMIILWCYFPLDYKIDSNRESGQTDERYEKVIGDFKKLKEAITLDATCMYSYNANNNTQDGEISNDIIKKYVDDSLLANSSLIYPVRTLEENDKLIVNTFIEHFKDLNLNNKACISILPAVFIVWLNSLNPNNDSKIEYDPTYKLLLTLLLRVRANDERGMYLDSRLARKILNQGDECRYLYKKVNEKICRKKCCNNEEKSNCMLSHYKKYRKLLKGEEAKLGTKKKQLERLLKVFRNPEISIDEIDVKEYIEDYIEEDFLDNYKEKNNMNFEYIQVYSEKFWDVMTDYARNRENNNRYNVSYGNINAFKKLFLAMNECKECKDYFSKALSLVHLNKHTKWVDLLLLENRLQLDATDINGLLTKDLLCTLYYKLDINLRRYNMFYCTQYNYYKYIKNKGLFDIQNNMFFLDLISEGINIILVKLQEYIKEIAKDKSKFNLHFFDKAYKVKYNKLFDTLMNEKSLKKISKASIVKLAEHEFLKTVSHKGG